MVILFTIVSFSSDAKVYNTIAETTLPVRGKTNFTSVHFFIYILQLNFD